MNCPRCGSSTQAGQKFCPECGLALGTICPNCGTPFEGSPKFCAECGTTLGAGAITTQPTGPGEPAQPSPSPQAMPFAERRYVTVLFADLVGFTTMSEQQDAEEVRDLLSRYFDTAREVIEGYGGSVEKFIGDAVMAVWGAPVAREDDPERAVRAGLELVDRVRQLGNAERPLALRAGVLSGEAAVSPGRVGEGMIAGDLVNTASRLQSVAPSGVVLVGESTQQATSPAIAYEPAGEQLLKGKQAPVPAWRALRVVARVGGGGRDEGLEPPFVGREEELRQLKDQLHTAERERKVRVVAITGQAGMGKSRLVWELEKYLDGLAAPLYYWHQGRSPSYGEGVTYWALGEMIRRRATIAEGEDENATRAKLRSALDQFVPDPDEQRWLEPALGALLGINEADWGAREQLFSAWRTFLERVADQGPSVFVFEDLHWADSGLLDFIDHVLEWTRDRPMLIVTLARPEILDRRPNFGLGHHAFVSLHVEPLGDAAMEALLRGLVPALPDDDLRRIVERAEGVPLYAVETVRSLVDGGHLVRNGDVYQPVDKLPMLEIPPTLRALIASRLDALETADSSLLQDASVLGIVFSVTALGALSGRASDDVTARLRVLSNKELVALETDPRSPERGQYRFTQGLIREVAYGTLSKRERRSRHLSAARYFDTLGDDELAAVLANHYLEAYKAAPEGAEGAAIAAQARVALRAAAERASRLHSHEQALAYFDQAMAVTFDEGDRTETGTQAAQSAIAVGKFDTAENYLRAAIAWHEERGDSLNAGETSALLGQMLLQGSRVDEAMDLLTLTLEQLPAEASRTMIQLQGQLARGHMFRDRADLALVSVSRGLEAEEGLDRRAASLQLIITKSWALQALRRPRESTALLLGAMRMADDEGELGARTRARYNLSGYLSKDDPHLALEIAQECMALAQQFGLTLFVANAAGNAAAAALVIGDLARVLSLEEGVAQVTNPIGLGIHGYAAAAAALRGDKEGALRRMAIVHAAQVGSSSAQDLSTIGYQEAMIGFAEGNLQKAQGTARQGRDAYVGADSPLAAVLAAHVSILLRDVDGLKADRAWLASNAIFGAWLDRSLRTVDVGALALDGNTAEARAAYRRVIDEWRAADLRLDLALALLARARLLGAVDEEAAAGRDEVAGIFSAMGADGLLERLEAGATAQALAVKRTPSTLPAGAATARR
ncbi:MAG: AAA family ATPase [Candidatus Limnocylindrales bacterium]